MYPPKTHVSSVGYHGFTWALLGSLWALLGLCWAYMGSPGSLLGLSWALMGSFGAVLVLSWAPGPHTAPNTRICLLKALRAFRWLCLKPAVPGKCYLGGLRRQKGDQKDFRGALLGTLGRPRVPFGGDLGALWAC